MERYPVQTTATIDSLRNSGWKAATEAGGHEGYPGLWQALSTAARSTIEGGRFSEGKCLWLLADACALTLYPDSINEPFKPPIMVDDRYSPQSADFQQVDIALFAECVREADNPWLRARLADLIWLQVEPRNPEYALLAIDAYRTIPLDAGTWAHGGRECWARAINLTRMLKAIAADRMQEIEAAVVAAFEASSIGNGNLALELADLLATHRLGHSRHLQIATRLETMAHTCDVEGNLPRARACFEAASTWFQHAGNIAKAAEMTMCLAEEWAKEAGASTPSASPGNVAATSCYENAIQAYFSIPHSERSAYRADARIAELHKHLHDIRRKSLGDMNDITSPPIDVAGRAETAIRAVRGKSGLDALAAFANIHSGASVNRIRELAAESLRADPVQAALAVTHLSRDGHVIAKRPGIGSGDIDSEVYQVTLWAEMIKHYGAELDQAVQGAILPALEVLRLEHRFRMEDFVAITHRSPMIPIERSHLVGRALFAGYDDDFVAALHFLVPQVEHMVRWHLKSAGIKTTTVDKDGIETENGFGSLIDIPEVAQIFGEDLAFEFKAIFCNPFGPNLRNELAHGLLTEDDCQSSFAIYAWWLGIRILFSTFRNAVRRPTHKGA